MTKPEQIKIWGLKPVDGFTGNIIIRIVVHVYVFKWISRKGEKHCASWKSNSWCSLISVCSIVCCTSDLGIIKPMNLKLTASCFAMTGEDKEIK